jgi:hypothetical protein
MRHVWVVEIYRNGEWCEVFASSYYLDCEQKEKEYAKRYFDHDTRIVRYVPEVKR